MSRPCRAAPSLRLVGAALAGLLLAGCAGPLRRADGLLNEAERRLAPAPRRSCKPVDAARLVGDEKLPKAARDALLSKVRWDLERHYNCLAFARRDPGVCDELAATKLEIIREAGVPSVDFPLLCKTIYYEALMAADVIGKGGRIKDLCIKRNLIGDRDFRLDSLDVSCGIIAEHQGDTAHTCGRLDPYFDHASIAKTCPKMLRFVSGDVTVCPLLPDPMVNDRCHGYVALKNRDCGDSVFCLQARGAGEELCEPTGRALAAAACETLEALQPPPAVEPVLVEAAGELAGLEGKVPAAQLERRLERLARLRLKAEAGR